MIIYSPRGSSVIASRRYCVKIPAEMRVVAHADRQRGSRGVGSRRPTPRIPVSRLSHIDVGWLVDQLVHNMRYDSSKINISRFSILSATDNDHDRVTKLSQSLN